MTKEAARSGLPPDAWVEEKIKESSSPRKKKSSEKRRRDALKAFVGAIDTSSRTKGVGTAKEVFGQIVERKMKRAGLKVTK